jgi:hypothetical protein
MQSVDYAVRLSHAFRSIFLDLTCCPVVHVWANRSLPVCQLALVDCFYTSCLQIRSVHNPYYFLLQVAREVTNGQSEKTGSMF